MNGQRLLRQRPAFSRRYVNRSPVAPLRSAHRHEPIGIDRHWPRKSPPYAPNAAARQVPASLASLAFTSTAASSVRAASSSRMRCIASAPSRCCLSNQSEARCNKDPLAISRQRVPRLHFGRLIKPFGSPPAPAQGLTLSPSPAPTNTGPGIHHFLCTAPVPGISCNWSKNLKMNPLTRVRTSAKWRSRAPAPAAPHGPATRSQQCRRAIPRPQARQAYSQRLRETNLLVR